MDSIRHLHFEGRLVATAEVVDTYRHDRDEWHIGDVELAERMAALAFAQLDNLAQDLGL